MGEYVGNLVALFRELRRVLTDDGTIRIDIDAASGELIRTSRELLRIGSLPVTRSAH